MKIKHQSTNWRGAAKIKIKLTMRALLAEWNIK